MLRDMEIGDSGNVEIEMGEAAFVLKTSLSSLETKSLSDAGTLPASMDEAEINNCTLIFFEGTQVSSIMEGLFVNKENYIVKTINISGFNAMQGIPFLIDHKLPRRSFLTAISYLKPNLHFYLITLCLRHIPERIKRQ